MTGLDPAVEELVEVAVVITDYELTVWDRYGKQIYRTTNQKQGWNGSAMNEYYVDTGVYTWILRYRPQRNGGLPEQMQGNITLLR